MIMCGTAWLFIYYSFRRIIYLDKLFFLFLSLAKRADDAGIELSIAQYVPAPRQHRDLMITLYKRERTFAPIG
jgi:hypothetical protein